MGSKAPNTPFRDQDTREGQELFMQTDGWQHDYANAMANGNHVDALAIATKMGDPVKKAQAESALRTTEVL